MVRKSRYYTGFFKSIPKLKKAKSHAERRRKLICKFISLSLISRICCMDLAAPQPTFSSSSFQSIAS